MSETGHEVGVPRRRQPKKIVFSSCQYLGLSAQTIRNRLHADNLWSHRAARRPAMMALHRQAHLHWNLNMWRNVMFNNKSRFCLRQLDRRVKVWRRCRERYANCCTDRVISFGGGSVMVWGGISLTGKTRVTNTTTLADLRQLLVEGWDAIPQQCVTRLVTSMRKRCQAVVAVYGSSTRY
ncbi:hypothetical protein MHYP_G00129690 [Metynnis hypsauchen]